MCFSIVRIWRNDCKSVTNFSVLCLSEEFLKLSTRTNQKSRPNYIYCVWWKSIAIKIFQTLSEMLLNNLQGRLTIFLIIMCFYSGIVTLFYLHNPVRKYRYLSVHLRSKSLKRVGLPIIFKLFCVKIAEDYGNYPMYNPRSHCYGCDRLQLNAGDTKVRLMRILLALVFQVCLSFGFFFLYALQSLCQRIDKQNLKWFLKCQK